MASRLVSEALELPIADKPELLDLFDEWTSRQVARLSGAR
jgi:hypothetical protein